MVDEVSLPVVGVATLLGAYRWTEHRLFELTGAWAAEPAPPAVRVHFDVVSGEHAWHAELWAARLPVLDWFDPDAVTGPLGSAGPLRPVPQVEEIRLHLARDALGLWQRTEDERGTGQPPPFWAFAWPGGQALARYVLDHPAVVAGRGVLDLGSGSGLVAIAAAMAGAATVLASEIDPLAVAAIGLNARANAVPV